MDKNSISRAQSRTRISSLSISSTADKATALSAQKSTALSAQKSTALSAIAFLAFATLASACGAMVNDWKDHQQIAPEASYSIARRTGESARDLLKDEYFKSLVVELLVVPGYAPTQEAINRLQTFLERHLNKPNGIVITMGQNIPSNGKGTYSVSEVRALESRYRRERPQVDQLSVSILFVDGHSADDEGSRKLLGQAHYNSSIVVYENTLREAVTTAGSPLWKTEATVMMHEFGHLLGLVGEGIPVQSDHQDTLNGAHCKNPTCLMHYAVESTSAVNNPVDADVPELDAACMQDLQAATNNQLPTTARTH